jgi:hypothetical protein
LLVSAPAVAQDVVPDADSSSEEAPTPPEPRRQLATPGARAYEPPPRAESDDDFLDRGSALGAALAIGYGTEKWWTSHLRFMGERSLHPNLALFAHVLWPIFANEQPIKIYPARSWTFLAMVGPQAMLGDSDWRVRPFLRLGIGLQLVASEVEFRTGGQGETYSTTAVVGTAATGLRIRIARQLSLHVEGEIGRSKSFNPGLVEEATTSANSTLRRASLGLVFGR